MLKETDFELRLEIDASVAKVKVLKGSNVSCG